MAKRQTQDGLAYYDDELGVEVATGLPRPLYPGGIRQLWALLVWKITGLDPSNPFPRPENPQRR